MNLLLRYYNLNWFKLFFGIVLVNLILIWLSKTVLINEIVFYNTYSEQLTYDRSLRLFENMNSIAWISYVFTPIVLLIRFSLISLILYIGIVFCNIQDKISLGSVFKVVVASEIIFVLGGITKFLWFYLFAGNYDLNDLGFFSPLSLINFFNKSEVSRIWVFPLQTVNLFHLIYIISISYGLSKVGKIKSSDSEKVLLLSYLPGLVIWIAFIMFLTIDKTI
jgi:hypothetical protein